MEKDGTGAVCFRRCVRKSGLTHSSGPEVRVRTGSKVKNTKADTRCVG